MEIVEERRNPGGGGNYYYTQPLRLSRLSRSFGFDFPISFSPTLWQAKQF